MQNSHSLLKYILVATTCWSQLAWSISKELHAMVRMETHSNAVATRDSGFVRMEHYEIPLDLVEKDIADRTNSAFLSSMIFEREGTKFVRWLINPEDTKWHLQVANFLKTHGLSSEKKTYFVGYMTASRSYIVVDPKSGAEFSIKMSTDHTGGNWKDKQQTWDDAKQIRVITDFVAEQVKKQPALRNTILLDEPMAFGIKVLDQAMVVRSYEALKNSGNRYVPGFSAMYETFGRSVALANGHTSPAKFWEENYNKPLARALAEFAALTGMSYDSPHSQNFLIELDKKNRPTGKIVLRDFGDTYLFSEYFEAVNRTDILKLWEQSNLKRGYMPVSVGILHGNTAPSWIAMDKNTVSKSSYDQWGREFFAEFQKEFKSQTGITLTSMKEAPRRGGSYIQDQYSLKDEAGLKFIELVKQGHPREGARVGLSCASAF